MSRSCRLVIKNWFLNCDHGWMLRYHWFILIPVVRYETMCVVLVIDTVRLQLVRGNPGVRTRSCVGKLRLTDEWQQPWKGPYSLLKTPKDTTESQWVMNVFFITLSRKMEFLIKITNHFHFSQWTPLGTLSKNLQLYLKIMRLCTCKPTSNSNQSIDICMT